MVVIVTNRIVLATKENLTSLPMSFNKLKGKIITKANTKYKGVGNKSPKAFSKKPTKNIK